MTLNILLFVTEDEYQHLKELEDVEKLDHAEPRFAFRHYKGPMAAVAVRQQLSEIDAIAVYDPPHHNLSRQVAEQLHHPRILMVSSGNPSVNLELYAATVEIPCDHDEFADAVKDALNS